MWRDEESGAENIGRGGSNERQLREKVSEERLACGGVADGVADRGPGQSRGAVGVGEGTYFEVGENAAGPCLADCERVGWDRSSQSTQTLRADALNSEANVTAIWTSVSS